MQDFTLTYIGCATVFSGKTALGGVKDEKDMFLKVCTRAIDKSISDLQKSFDEFKVELEGSIRVEEDTDMSGTFVCCGKILEILSGWQDDIAAVKRDLRFGLHFLLEIFQLVGANIRRIGHYYVEFSARQSGKHIRP